MKQQIKRFAACLLTAVLAAGSVSGSQMMVYAEESGTEDTPVYSEDNPFVLPSSSGSAKTVEAEAFILDSTNAAEGKHVRIEQKSEASGGMFVGWFEEGNRILLPFTAEQAGLYKVTVTYVSGRSESNPNSLEWSGTHIKAGTKDVWGEQSASVFHSAEIQMEVTEAGVGELIFTASSKCGPNLDKLEFELLPPAQADGVTLNRSSLNLALNRTYQLVATVSPANAEDKTVTYTTSNGAVATVTEEGVVTGVSEGTATITATVAGGFTATCEVTVGGTVQAPDAWGAVPSPNQYRYQKEELAAFCHFGPNTFNEIEWGEHYGDQAPSEIFHLEQDFDAETIVKALKEAGFKKLIVTAKHHDGFCIWDSEWTDYTCAEAGYKDGKGDVLADISAACTKYDMNMGLYLSPWDIHDASYGYYDADGNALCGSNGQPLNGKTWEEVEELDVKDYNEYYDNQLEEILGSEKYGNNGHFVEVWMDGAKGGGANAQNYDFQRWFTTIQSLQGKAAGYDDDCMLFGAEAYTTVRWIGNENGLAAEETWAKSKTDKEANTIDSNSSGGYTKGFYDGNQWTVPEADARITSGWFWGSNKKTPKSIADLANMYFNSVGHNATFLLNVPPNTDGTIDQEILDRVKEFGENVRDSFKTNLAADALVTASAVREDGAEEFAPANVLDGDDETYWTMDDEETTGSLTLDLGRVKTFDLVTIEEAIQLGQRISGFTVEYKNGDGDWQQFSEGTTIGAKRICRGTPVKADKVRINITASYAVPLISEVGLFKATEGFAQGSSVPEALDIISVSDTDVSDGAGFTYTGWTAESGDRFLDGHSMYAGSGTEASVKFTGSKVWLYGTKDPSHGTADIYIDGTKVDSINTNTPARATAQMIYESKELALGEHTLRIVNTGTIGLDAAVVLNNGGKGMLQFETKTLEMEEDSVTEVKVKRVGGSSGAVSVAYENNPGSAVQMDYDANIGGTLNFADGETEKKITITTKRDDRVKGDIDFTVDILNPSGGAVLGFYPSLRVIIHDMDDPNNPNPPDTTVAVTKVTLSPEKLTITDLEEHALTAVVLPENATNKKVTYESSKPDVASVNAAGVVIGKKNGESVITVTTEDGNKTAECTVTVAVQEYALDELDEALSGVEQIIQKDESKYTPESWAAFKKAYDNANARDEDASISTLERLLKALEKAQRELVVYDSHQQAVEELDNYITEVKDIFEAGQGKYTSESWNVFVTAYNNAKNRLETAAESEIKQLLSDLEASKKGLRETAVKPPAAVPLAAPKGLKVSAVSTGVQITFQRVANASSYEIYRKSGNGAARKIAAIKTLSYLDKTAPKGQRLTYTVVALPSNSKAYTKSAASVGATITLTIQAAALKAPTGVTAASKMTGVQITFQKAANASSYEIYRQIGTGAAEKIATVTTDTYEDISALGGTKLTYTVVALPSNSAYLKSAASMGASLTLPKTVKGLKAKVIGGKVKISFKKVKGASNYVICRATAKNGKYKKIAALKGKKTSYIDKKVKKGKTYYYKVITKTKKLYSPSSNVRQVKVKK